ncbi:PP2C family protein-serine/threonine phosphatase [Geothermobacter hydrogeniphilus]|uniref:Serine/threonine protein phosphatase n=1 Tax=Geothermobacter hydrogeniphilus TaxID=1969733 RepID=A0A1X0Y0D2_9BACT|nr:PP2C family protein-serine/threonine phosphatase [Geothermobacter hydrogeniphilus]ORJ58548.1 serine/threonine protein phosphatase [Geothermobacter hydrogeniphilus]
MTNGEKNGTAESCNCSFDLDLDLASGVQQLLFPKSSPVCNWSCIGIKNRMAQGVGGDYFDFITLGDGCQLIFLGDVTGHGLQASLVMGLLYGFIHRSAAQDCDPLRVLREINTFLRLFAKRSEKYDYFFSSTLFCGVINPDSLCMEYVNAGHVAPVVRRGDELFRLEPSGQPLGYFDQPELDLELFRLRRGDRLLLFTDGITEAEGRNGEQFGRRRLERLVRDHHEDHLDFLDEVFASLQRFGVSDPLADDCTAIVIDMHGAFGRHNAG